MLPDTARDILNVLGAAEKPLKGRSVATRCHREFNSHFRLVVSGLVKSGQVLVAAPVGYWLASRPLPEGVHPKNTPEDLR